MKTCPFCGGEVVVEDNMMVMRVRDGNTIYQCQNSPDHRFWKNMRSMGTYHWHPHARCNGFEWYRAFEYSDGHIVKTHVNDFYVDKKPLVV